MHHICCHCTGTPPPIKDNWVDQVEWARGNALEPQSYQHHLKGAIAVISCIGGFGSNAQQLKVSAIDLAVLDLALQRGR